MTFETFMQNLLYVLATAILPLLTTYIVLLIKNKIKEQSAKLESEKLQKYIDTAMDTLSTIVLSVQQTYVSSLKDSGKFDKEAQEKAKQMAINKANELISEESKKAIEILYNDYYTWISDQIECLVYIENKNNKIEVS